MALQKWETGAEPRRQAVPGGPIAEVVIGADADVGVGVVDVTVPAGAMMTEHTHGDSTTLLIPQAGSMRLIAADDDAVIELEPGVMATIPIGQRVRLENPGTTDGRMLVVLTPADFATAVATWPELA